MGGIKQGCPLSAILFILCIVILVCAIISNANKEGITILNKKNQDYIKLMNYLSMLMIWIYFLKNGEQTLQVLDSVIEFGQVSGLTLN